MNGCKNPVSLLTYSSPLVKRVRSNVAASIAAKQLAMVSGKMSGRKTFDFSMLDLETPNLPSTSERSYWGGAKDAFIDYTFGGPIELMAGKSTAQAGLLTRTGLYATFRRGLSIEIAMDFAIAGAVLTVMDPANKWEGGADEWGVLGGNQDESLPGTMSGEEGTTFLWGLKQGHLGFLFGN